MRDKSTLCPVVKISDVGASSESARNLQDSDGSTQDPAVRAVKKTDIVASPRSNVTHARKKFAKIDHMNPESGAPVVIGADAHFECRNEDRHYGGDHIKFVGRSSATHIPPSRPYCSAAQIHARRAADPALRACAGTDWSIT